jgi:Transposase domain (DUF772)
MMIALVLYGYCQGERCSWVVGQRCVREVAYRVIVGGLHPDHATIARFRVRHQQALGALFSQVLRRARTRTCTPTNGADSGPRPPCPRPCERDDGCVTTAAGPTTNSAAKPWNRSSDKSRPARG